MSLHRFSFAACITFLLGIAIHSCWPETRAPLMLWTGFAIAFVCGFSVLSRTNARIALLFIAICVVGAWMFDLTIPSSTEGMRGYEGQNVMIEGRVFETGRAVQSPDFLQVHTVNGESMHGKGSSVAVWLPATVLPWDRVRFSCVVKPVSPFAWGRSAYLRRDAWMSCTNVGLLETIPSSGWDPLIFLTSSREWLTARIHRRFESDDAALLAGMLYGGDDDLSSERRTEFRDAGLIHLVAVSGSNVTLVVSVLMPLAFAFGARRRSAFLCATVGIVAFLGFVGASASVVRAGIMGWLALLAREFGRLPKPEHLLVCAAVFICLFNPRTLAFDAGFHLSMLATWGLLAWAKPFEERLMWVPAAYGFRSGLATTIAVTLMLFPYALWMFGSYSVAGLLTNLIALPMVSWVMFFGFVSVIVPDVLASIASVPVAGFLHVLQFLADVGAKLPKMETTKSSVWVLLASYGGIFLMDRRLRYPQSPVFGGRVSRIVGELQQRLSKKSVDEIGPPE